tara:strand:+ start:5720 stop:6190 length:471 start_codon:yes stop_codon:yes gene_type:complete
MFKYNKVEMNTIKNKANYILPHNSDSSLATNTRIIIRSFGNIYNSGLNSSPLVYPKNVLGPFRTATNAGDVLGYDKGATNIKYGDEPNKMSGHNILGFSSTKIGGSLSRSGDASYSGNPRFVYDGSDYIRFKKLQAHNKRYNNYDNNIYKNGNIKL